MIKPELGKRYNWKGQPKRLVYLGYNFSGNGHWHQFALISKPDEVWCEVQPDELPCFEVSQPRLVSRTEAYTELAEPQDQKIRNYEFEAGYAKRGEYVVISEWCPHNGIFCSWLSHCPKEELVKLIEEWAKLTSDQINYPYLVQQLKTELERRAR